MSPITTIRDAILAGASADDIAALPLPDHYRAALVRADEQEMFADMASDQKDPRKSIHLDDIPVNNVPRFVEELVEHLRAESTILKEIRESGDLSDEVATRLGEEIKKVLESFHVEEADSLVG